MAKEKGKVPVRMEPERGGPMESPWQPLIGLREEMDRLFDEFWSGWPMGRGRRRGRGFLEPFRGFPMLGEAGMPAVDVIDKGTEIQVRADLPGLDEQDIDVRLSNDTLIIRGEKKEEREEGQEEGSYYLSERRYGSFQRTLSVPAGIDAEKVEASFRNGVLTITLPKTPEAQEKTRKIEVKGEK